MAGHFGFNFKWCDLNHFWYVLIDFSYKVRECETIIACCNFRKAITRRASLNFHVGHAEARTKKGFTLQRPAR